jgi:Cas7 group CRISPR-associated protein Csh2
MTNTKPPAPFNRVTGLVIVEVRCSNPNGDPDMESDPRTLEADGRGVISPVSFKRKLRDLVADKDGPVWREWAKSVEPREPDCSSGAEKYEYEILETRFRDRDEISKLEESPFRLRYWDARVFGNTFLESMKEKKLSVEEKKKFSHFVSTGAVQVGVGLSIARIDIDRMTQTSKSGVEKELERGMAPLSFRVVRHGLYTIPLFVNPTVAVRTGMTARDLSLLRFLLPYTYSHTASAIRPFVNVLHAWWIKHKNPFGSCPDYLLIDALTPRREDGGTEPSTSLVDYTIPTSDEIPKDVLARVECVEDACSSVRT